MYPKLSLNLAKAGLQTVEYYIERYCNNISRTMARRKVLQEEIKDSSSKLCWWEQDLTASVSGRVTTRGFHFLVGMSVTFV